MYTANPTPAVLADSLRSRFPDIHIHPSGEYVNLTAGESEVFVWVNERSEILRIRAVVAKRHILEQLTAQERHKLTVSLNSNFNFGRFNGESVIGLVHDYDVPYVPSISIELVAPAIDIVGEQACVAREISESHLKRAKRRAKRRVIAN